MQGLNYNADPDTDATEGPFSIRGGNFWNGTNAGAFAFADNNGNAWNNYSYRVVLVCEQHFDANKIRKKQGLDCNADEDTGGTDGPFCQRGGHFWNGTGAGAFAFVDNDGNANNNHSYRLVLVCEQHFDANKIEKQGLNCNADEDTGTGEYFSQRGGNYWSNTYAGAFAFDDSNGNGNNNWGYRLVLVCEQHFGAK